MHLARNALAALAWLFIALLTIQVFLAGVGLFGAGRMSTHVDFGYTISGVPLLLLIAATVGRAGRLIGMSAVLLVLAFVQTSLPYFRDDLPFIAALHPVNALALFWLTATIARRATELARAPHAEAEAAPAQ
jgi:hypothetical protein